MAARAPHTRHDPADLDLIDVLLAGDAAAIALAEARVRAQVRRDARALVASAERAVATDPTRIWFDETGYATLTIDERRLSAGRFDVRTLAELRRGARAAGSGAVTVSALDGVSALTDIGSLQAFASERTLFQVASQFNCLEAPGPALTKVSHYFSDSTQGPRASISAFPGTLVRHYAAPGGHGMRFVQTEEHQLDLLAEALPTSAGRVTSGYLMLQNVRDVAAAAAALDERFDQIAVGVHDGVQVVLGHAWDGDVPGAPRIAQVFTSSLAVGYSQGGSALEAAALCRPLLRAAYLGTLLAAAGLGKARVVLTLIGGGVFGNPLLLVWDSIFWAADQAADAGATLQVIVNAHGAGVPPDAADRCAERGGRVVVVR